MLCRGRSTRFAFQQKLGIVVLQSIEPGPNRGERDLARNHLKPASPVRGHTNKHRHTNEHRYLRGRAPVREASIAF